MRGGRGGGGHGHGLPDVDKHGLMPKLGRVACFQALLILVACADTIGHAMSWIGISRGLDPATLTLAEKEAEHYSFGCDTADVAAFGILRGLVMLIVVIHLTCCATERLVPAEDQHVKWVLGEDYKKGEKLKAKAKKFVPEPSAVRPLVTCLLLALAAASAAKAIAVTNEGCTDDPTTPWLSNKRREELVWSSLVVGVLELLFFTAQNMASRAELLAAAKEAERRGETAALLPGMVRPGENSGASLTRLLGLAKSEVCLITVGMVMLLVSTMTNLVLPQVAGDIVDAISTKQGDHHMNIVIRNFLFIVVAGSVTTAVRNYIFTLVGQRLVYLLRSQVYKAIVSQETAFFDESKTGELLNRLSNDTQVMQSSITQNISMFLRSITSAVMATCIMLYISPTLGGVVLGIVPVLICTAATYGSFVRRLSKRVQDALAKATESAEESLSNIRTVRAFSKEWSEIHKYQRSVYDAFKLGRTMAIASGSFMGFIFMMVQFTLAFVLWLGGREVMAGHITIGELTTFLLYVIMVASNFGMLSGVWPAFMTALGASEKVFFLLDRVPEIKFAGGITPTTPSIGQVDLSGVWFHYKIKTGENAHEGSGSMITPETAGTDMRPTDWASAPALGEGDSAWVLKDINLSVAPGSTVALVGPSGAGKSTVFSLLERFYRCQSGTIKFDGVDVMDLDPVYLRRKMALVAQEPVLFADTIFNNIAYGAAAVDGEEDFENELKTRSPTEMAELTALVEECARAANAHNFITGFEEGYNTVVGERGALSHSFASLQQHCLILLVCRCEAFWRAEAARGDRSRAAAQPIGAAAR